MIKINKNIIKNYGKEENENINIKRISGNSDNEIEGEEEDEGKIGTEEQDDEEGEEVE